VEVDGQDVLAVHEVAGQALARARAGEGPSLIECRTYRFVGHHEGDPGTGYRTPEEIEEWKKRDPIRLFATSLLKNQLATQEALDALDVEARAEIQDAVEFADKSPWPTAETAMTELFATPI
jgi:pyruvate dehydrogenase E1 component alpha subunit